MKPQVYKDPRPAEHFTRFHERVRNGKPDLIYELVRLLLTPVLLLFYRTRCIDSHKVPLEGPAVITPNHFSFFDHFFVAVYLRRKVHFMAKSQLFKRPMQFIFTHGGVFPVLRGRRDDEAFKTAHAVLARGGLVVMYAEGGRSRTGQLGQARPGVGRIALESGVPIVPAAISGSAEVRNWKRLQFPRVTVRFGKPFRFDVVEHPTREQQQEIADYILVRIRELHGELERLGHRGALRAARARVPATP